MIKGKFTRFIKSNEIVLELIKKNKHILLYIKTSSLGTNAGLDILRGLNHRNKHIMLATIK